MKEFGLLITGQLRNATHQCCDLLIFFPTQYKTKRQSFPMFIENSIFETVVGMISL